MYKVTIVYIKDFEEYQVPDGNGSHYHTDDKEDAVSTCKVIHGADVLIKHRRK